MGGGDEEVFDKILGACAHADAAFAAAGLTPVGIDGSALEVAAVRDGDGHVFHRDQVFEADIAGVFDDLGAALIAEIFADLFEFLDDEFAEYFFGAQDFEVLADAPLDVEKFVGDLLLLHAGEALQLQFDDGLGLLFAELRQRRSGARGPQIKRVEDEVCGSRDEVFTGFFGRPRSADDADDFIDIIERQTEAEQHVLAVARFAQFEIGTAANDIDAMLDEVFDGADEAEFARLAVDDREIDDAEADLELSLLIEVVQDDIGLFAPLQFEDDAHAVAIALIANFRNAFNFLFVNQ